MIISFIFGFIGGIVLGSLVSVTPWLFAFLVVVSGIVFIYKYFIEEQHRKIIFLAFFFLFGVLGGVGRMYVSDLYSESKLVEFSNQKISATGIVVAEPDIREKNMKLTVRLSTILVGTTTVSVREKILVTTPLYPEFSYGDKVELSVVIQEPKNIENDDGRVFDYQGYLRVRGIWYTGSFAQVKLITSGHGSIVKNLLFKTKHAFTDSIDSVLPQPQSSLLAGLLLGTKQSLGEKLLEEFRRTGTSHIVVLSGYNIAIVAESIMNAFKFLPPNYSFGLGVVSIILFTILSGGGASASRAAIMVLVALFAKRTNRDYKAGRVLGFTVIAMLTPNPLLLVFDPSFQLSVLATIGIVFVSPIVSPYFTKVTERFGLREIVSSTVATQITVLPFLIYNTGLLSLISLPVNVLILSTIPLTMFLGFITGIAGLFSLYLSFIPAFFTYILLWYQLTIVHIGSSLSFGAISLPSFSPIVLISVYLFIFGGLYFVNNKPK